MSRFTASCSKARENQVNLKTQDSLGRNKENVPTKKGGFKEILLKVRCLQADAENEQTFPTDGTVLSASATTSHHLSSSISAGKSYAVAQSLSNVPIREMREDTIEEEEKSTAARISRGILDNLAG